MQCKYKTVQILLEKLVVIHRTVFENIYNKYNVVLLAIAINAIAVLGVSSQGCCISAGQQTRHYNMMRLWNNRRATTYLWDMIMPSSWYCDWGCSFREEMTSRRSTFSTSSKSKEVCEASHSIRGWGDREDSLIYICLSYMCAKFLQQ